MAGVAPGWERGSSEPTSPAPRTFVGRERELEELTDALDDAVEGSGDLFVVSGPSGIGKTRLAEELATGAERRDVRALWGRSSEDPGSPPFWPWIQILRSLGSHARPQMLLQDPGSADLDASDRFRLFDSVHASLLDASRSSALLLLMDDIQFADASSIRLLEFVAQNVREERLAIVALVRDGYDADVERARRLIALMRLGRSLPMRGLSQRELLRFVSARFGIDPPRDVMASLWRLTEGNPFFADEIVRLFLAERHAGATEGRDRLALPEGVRDVVRRRLEPLSARAHRTVRIASVAGREFDPSIVARACGLSNEEIDRDLTELVEHQVIDAAGAARFAFTHALMREALYEELGEEEAADAHCAVADAIESLSLGSAEGRTEQLAHHTYQARQRLVPEIPLSHLRRAGEAAMKRCAYEDAGAHFAKALSLLNETFDASERAHLTIALAESRRRAGSFSGAMDAFEAACGHAREASSPDLLARAAIGYEDSRLASGDFKPVPRSILLLADALNSLGGSDELLRAEVLSRRSLVLHFVGAPPELMLEPALEAVTIAERAGDDRLLMRTLEGLRSAYWTPEDAEGRLATTERLLATARRSGKGESMAMAEIFRFLDLLTLGRDGIDDQILAVRSAVGASRLPWLAWWPEGMAATRAVMRGDIDEARDRALVLAELEPGIDDNFARGAHALLVTACAWEDGDAGELGSAIGTMIEILDVPPARSALSAFADVVRGDLDGARKAFEEVAAGGFRSVPPGSAQLPILALLAEVCGRLGDAERAERLYRRMSGGPPVVVVVPPVSALLTTSHWLGLLAATANRVGDAERHFEEAVELHERIGAPAWTARTRAEHGRALLGESETRERGSALLASAHGLASSLGLRSLSRDIERTLQDEVQPVRSERNAFVCEGDVWRLSYAGRTVRIADLKGLHYLRVLLTRPSQEVHVLALPGLVEAGGGVNVHVREAIEAGLHTGASSPESIDAVAVRSYRARLEELRDEIDGAEAIGDAERASRAREEAGLIGETLAGSLGLGGRHRRSGTPTERTRVNVQRTIRKALDRVAAAHPELARHLTDTVRTGTSCIYLGESGWLL